MQNDSPWLKQLNESRVITELNSDLETDVCVVGGGIAGASTAFFLMKNTKKKVILIEAGKIAHGATGHNAGQVIAHIERPFDDMVKEFGEKMVIKAYDQLYGAWDLLDEMIAEAKIQTPLYKTTGTCGYTSLEEIVETIKTNAIEYQSGLNREMVFISEKTPFFEELQKKYL
ncbi:FAD-binding oxidoreductase [Candidatus Peregrinibacteria bacterium]|nr:FAD-binding oxidoreductase [Candidatus Peregrinibacteria bacterium]